MSLQKTQDTLHRATTGEQGLDRIARLSYGMSWVLSIDDRAGFTPLVESIVSEGLASGDGIIYSPPARLSFQAADEGLKRLGADLPGACGRKSAFLVDHYERRVPAGLKPFIVESNTEVEDRVVFEAHERSDQRWRILSDLNGEYYSCGADALRRRLTARQSRARERGDLYIGFCNFREMPPELAEFIKQSCDGVIEIYVKGKYQFLKVSKSPGGWVSNEFVLVPSDSKPYIRLVQK
jgi:hypothetical protein